MVKHERQVDVLTIPSEAQSASLLGFPVLTDIYNFKRRDIVWRWGYSHGPIYLNTINKSEAITLNCNKLRALQAMSKVVTVPEVYVDLVPKGKTAVVRPREHTCGEDFRIVNGPAKIEYGYGKEALLTGIEYRVWFCFDETLTGLRVPIDEKQKKEDRKRIPCRSEWGYRFLETPWQLRQDTLAAAGKIGLDTGAADVLYHKQRYVFLELNSAPTLDCRKLVRFYQFAFQRHQYGQILGERAPYDRQLGPRKGLVYKLWSDLRVEPYEGVRENR